VRGGLCGLEGLPKPAAPQPGALDLPHRRPCPVVDHRSSRWRRRARANNRVVGIQRSTADRAGKHLDVADCIVFELKDGRVTDGREHFEDLYAWDEFWA
jgi:hypothetical protein